MEPIKLSLKSIKVRKDWGYFNPVQRIKRSGKVYSRAVEKQTARREYA